MHKYLQIALFFICFQVKGQYTPLPEMEHYTQLAEKGDSSIYLVEINDTLSYISFADPNTINNAMSDPTSDSHYTNQHILPERSYLLLMRETHSDTFVYRETFNKYYLSTPIDYSIIDRPFRNKKQLNVSFAGKDFISQDYFNSFSDSMYVEVENEKYLGDLNTSTFSVDVPRPKKKRVEVRILNANGRIDFTIDAKIKKSTYGLFIAYEILESTLHSSLASEYVEKEITLTSINGRPIQFKFIDLEHFRTSNEIKYR